MLCSPHVMSSCACDGTKIEVVTMSEVLGSDLLATTPAIVAQERDAIARVVERLAELDTARSFVEAGYASLFDYCRRKLLYSEGAANRRIRAARCLAKDPSISAKLRSGEISLCTLSTAATEIGKGTVALEEIAGRSKREVEAIVAKVNPVVAAKRERVRPLTVMNTAVNTAMSTVMNTAVKARVMPDTAPLFAQITQPTPPPGERGAGRLDAPPPGEALYEVKFTLTKSEYEELMRVRSKLSNTLGANNSVARVVSTLVHRFLNPKTRKKSANATTSDVPSKRSRYIPREVRRDVQARDNERCQFVAPDGTRCAARCYLHIDHVTPFALGGTATAENTRLLCASHNRLLAVRVFGEAKVPSRKGL